MNALKQKRINFFEVYTRKPGMSVKAKTTIGYLLPVIGLAAAGAVAIALQYNEISSTKAAIATERTYLSNPEVSAKYSEYEGLYDQVLTLTAVAEDLRNALSAIHSYPDVRSDILNEVDKYAGNDIQISAVQYDEKSGLLTITGSSKDVNDAGVFAENIEQIDAFINVDYSGYQNNSNSRYYFTIQCLVRGNAQKEVQ